MIWDEVKRLLGSMVPRMSLQYFVVSSHRWAKTHVSTRRPGRRPRPYEAASVCRYPRAIHEEHREPLTAKNMPTCQKCRRILSDMGETLQDGIL